MAFVTCIHDTNIFKKYNSRRRVSSSSTACSSCSRATGTAHYSDTAARQGGAPWRHQGRSSGAGHACNGGAAQGTVRSSRAAAHPLPHALLVEGVAARQRRWREGGRVAFQTNGTPAIDQKRLNSVR
jgi:hypothetical protein